MSLFPTEIWLEIFSLACTDAGGTGCSLSAVSHHFRRISADYRYQSLAAVTAFQLGGLWSRLSSIKQSLPPIRHLYIQRQTLKDQGPEDASDINSTDIDDHIRDILSWSSPTLRTLTLTSNLSSTSLLDIDAHFGFPLR